MITFNVTEEVATFLTETVLEPGAESFADPEVSPGKLRILTAVSAGGEMAFSDEDLTDLLGLAEVLAKLTVKMGLSPVFQLGIELGVMPDVVDALMDTSRSIVKACWPLTPERDKDQTIKVITGLLPREAVDMALEGLGVPQEERAERLAAAYAGA